MNTAYLHRHKDFSDLLNIVENETGIIAGLIEKDYWIMQVLYGLKSQGFRFELKGGTSLSKGFNIIERFSEDIDIHITPPLEMGINENPNNSKSANIRKKKEFYDWLTNQIKIDGIVDVQRDHAFDNVKNYNSGGIRLLYEQKTNPMSGLKDGILLEVGFDRVTPNTPVLISSWAYERAKQQIAVEIVDNRAKEIACYNPGYTFVEKLQTIATKFRNEQKEGSVQQPNYMRQYYDIYCLLANQEVLDFIGTEEYQNHKKIRFPKEDYDLPIWENEAFLLTDKALRDNFKKRYERIKALYYNGQPGFDDLLERIKEKIDQL